MVKEFLWLAGLEEGSEEEGLVGGVCSFFLPMESLFLQPPPLFKLPPKWMGSINRLAHVLYIPTVENLSMN